MSLDQPAPYVKPQNVTTDAFLGGRLTLAQPRQGFRAGLDSVLLGVSVAEASAHLLDLGAGVGTASLVALVHAPGARALLAEAEPDLVALARTNAETNGFAERVEVTRIDVGATGPERQAAGLVPDRFQTVIANPPFFDTARGTGAAGPARARARAMPGDGLERWVRTATAAAAPDGEVIFIHTSEALGPLVTAFAARLGAVSILPIVPRPGRPATRLLVRGIKGSRAPLTLMSPLVLHEAEGNHFAPAVAALLRGETRLDW